MLGLIIQAGVWMHATHVAQSAATRALEAARADGGTAANGERVGREALRVLAGNALHDAHVTVTRTATRTRVEITGTADTVLPGPAWPVTTTVVGPTERFVPDPHTPTPIPPAREGR